MHTTIKSCHKTVEFCDIEVGQAFVPDAENKWSKNPVYIKIATSGSEINVVKLTDPIEFGSMEIWIEVYPLRLTHVEAELLSSKGM